MNAESHFQTVGKILRMALGGIFLIAGVAKLPELSAFARTISDVTHADADVSLILAVAVVTCEILGGLALLLRFMVVQATVLLSVLVCSFLWILVSASFQGKEIQCRCFGILNIALANRYEILLDLVLFNLLAVLALISLPRKKEAGARGQRWIFGALVALLLFLQYSMFGDIILRRRAVQTSDLAPVISFLKARNHPFPTSTEGNRVLFLLHFPDFNCPPCFESFLKTQDIVWEEMGEGAGHRVLAMFKSGGNSSDPERLSQWAERTGLHIPILVAPDSLFTVLRFEKSGVFIISPSGTTLFSDFFPLEDRRMNSFVRYLESDYGSRR